MKSERRYKVGDRLTLVPNHVCSTVIMHDEVYGVRGNNSGDGLAGCGCGKVK